MVQFDDAPKSCWIATVASAQTEVLARCADRICGALRMGDLVARLEGGGFAVALAPVRRLDLETLVQLVAPVCKRR